MNTKNRKQRLDDIRNMKIPKHIDINDIKLLKKIFSKGLLTEGYEDWFCKGGFDTLQSMDKTIVGVA